MSRLALPGGVDCPVPVCSRLKLWTCVVPPPPLDSVESNPDLFYRFDVFSLMDGIRAQLAAFIGANTDDVAFVPNASDGVNTLLRSLRPPPGTKLLLLNTAYGMVKNTATFLEGFAAEQVRWSSRHAPRAVRHAVGFAVATVVVAVALSPITLLLSLVLSLLPSLLL